jgi:signal peptidase
MRMKVLRIAGRAASATLSALVALALVLVLAVAVAQRMTMGGVRSPLGTAVLSVLSGSMTPHIDTGDVVVDRLVTPAQAQHLRVGEIVTYRTTHLLRGQPVLITHRIVGILTFRPKGVPGAPAQRLYLTKGDANNAIDPQPVGAGQIVGVFWFRIPRLGYLSAFVRTRAGFALLIVLPVVYLVAGEFLRLWRRLGEAERRRALAPSADAGGDAAP